MPFSSFSYFIFSRPSVPLNCTSFPISPPPPSSSFLCYLLRSIVQHGEESPPFLPSMPILPPPQPCEQRQSQCKCRLPLRRRREGKRIMRPHFFCKGTCTTTGLEKKNQNGDFAAHFCESLSERGKWCIFHPFCHARTHCCLAH